MFEHLAKLAVLAFGAVVAGCAAPLSQAPVEPTESSSPTNALPDGYVGGALVELAGASLQQDGFDRFVDPEKPSPPYFKLVQSQGGVDTYFHERAGIMIEVGAKFYAVSFGEDALTEMLRSRQSAVGFLTLEPFEPTYGPVGPEIAERVPWLAENSERFWGEFTSRRGVRFAYVVAGRQLPFSDDGVSTTLGTSTALVRLD